MNISINGGTVTNVFGGGTHSSSTGSENSATEVTGDVTVTVTGGTIDGAIFARGQSATDTVSGHADVIFSGGDDFGCGVYGYTYVGGEDSSATLSYTDYTGTFYGAIGGFNSVTFDGGTAMDLTTAAGDVSNGKWEFDLSERADTLAGTSLLTWNNADFAGDTVKVAFADAAQAAAGWSIAAADFAGATFDLWIGGSEIATDIAYDTAVGGTGDWANWKFTSVGGTLKFAEIA